MGEGEGGEGGERGGEGMEACRNAGMGLGRPFFQTLLQYAVAFTCSEISYTDISTQLYEEQEQLSQL